MPHEFRPVASTQSMNKEKTGIQISVSFKRELTEDEGVEISKFMDKMMRLFRRNDLLANAEYMAQIEKDKNSLLACFSRAYIHVKEIPNEYEGAMAIMPWFVVTTAKGPIKIGWRKRVIEIDWNETGVEEWAEKLFPDEDVTKNGRSIHAWGYEKAKEYLDRLLS